MQTAMQLCYLSTTKRRIVSRLNWCQSYSLWRSRNVEISTTPEKAKSRTPANSRTLSQTKVDSHGRSGL